MEADPLRSLGPATAPTPAPGPAPTAWRSWRASVCIAILLTFFGWAGWYGYHHRHELQVLGQTPLWSLVALAAAAAGAMVCNGLYIKYVLRAFGVDLPAREWLALTAATSILNYISPMRGGAAMRAVYLKARYQFSFTDFLSTLSAMGLMYGLIHAAMGLVGAALLWRSAFRPPLPLIAFFVVVALAAIVLMIAPLRIPWSSAPGFRQAARIVEGWSQLRRRPRVFITLLLVTVLYALLSIAQFWLAFDGIGAPLDWGKILIYTAGQGLAMLITLTPGALGIAEWTGVYFGSLLSCTPAQVLLIQLLVRASYVGVLLVAAPFVVRFLVAAKALPAASTARANA